MVAVGFFKTSFIALAIVLIDRVGRKPLLYVSMVGRTGCLAALSAALFLQARGSVSRGAGVGVAILTLYGIFATSVGDMSDEDRDRERDRDRVWLHGEKVGAGFKYKYCRETKSGGGGTRLKEHLAHRGKNVKKCPSVPPDIKAYFQLDIDKTKEKKSSRFR
ncbi:hypothetical protein ZEAMMB73_Zm00001d011127 [Zea mays]|uniref:Uncharacterized protein n=1 Tax=Zea mays TaxID=4577 RepID=A0A1D6FWR3_MAIZE|nr:hypothetical protein ZEAMMB73_Zm00001d011127 [Zea mays]